MYSPLPSHVKETQQQLPSLGLRKLSNWTSCLLHEVNQFKEFKALVVWALHRRLSLSGVVTEPKIRKLKLSRTGQRTVAGFR